MSKVSLLLLFLCTGIILSAENFATKFQETIKLCHELVFNFSFNLFLFRFSSRSIFFISSFSFASSYLCLNLCPVIKKKILS